MPAQAGQGQAAAAREVEDVWEDALRDLARMLCDARRLGYSIDAAACELPRTKEEAYAVQDAVVALSGLPRAGYKVGSTSLEAQRLLGTDEPGAGALLAPYVHTAPAKVALVPANVPAVEGEFAFRLACDLPPRAAAYTLAEVASAIGSVAGAIEVVGTRFSGGLGGKGRLLTVADCGVNIALVTGAWTGWSGQDLRPHAVALMVNGTEKGAGTGSRALGDPLNVLLWLANHQSARKLGLNAGEVVSTGTCTGLAAVHRGDVVRADFGTLGTVEVAFE
jgi:2-keto-4-pentenoate hydratase